MPDGDDFSFEVASWLLPLATPAAGWHQEPRPVLDDHPPDLAGGLAAVLDVAGEDGDVSLALAAEAAGLSVRTLQRRLRREKTSFARLLRTWRLRRATRLLLETREPIIEIAMAVGYEDASNFARAFRAYAGCSPTAFRAGNADRRREIDASRAAMSRLRETTNG